MTAIPVLPYRGTTGYVDREASRERAEQESRSGRARERQQQIIKIVREAGMVGRTWKEVSIETPDLHHGQISAALSVLHKAGLLFARRTKRDGSHPYVAIEFRDLFTDDERYDVPARTTARQIRDRVDAALEAIAECQEIIESQRVSETDNSRQAIWDQSSALFAFVANKLTDEGNDDRMD